jgi:hypothetical protein
MEDWFSFLSKWTLIPMATIAVFEGTRRVSLTQLPWRGAALLLFGIGVLGGYAGALSWGASGIAFALQAVDGGAPPAVPEAALAQMSAQEREEKTRLLAQIKFQKTGSLATYSSVSGQQIQYAPSEKEIRDRQTLLESLAQTRTRLEFIRTQVWMFVLAAIAAAAAGIYARSRGGATRED